MTENEKGWAPAPRRSLQQILRHISLEDLADKMSRLFFPGGATAKDEGWTNASLMVADSAVSSPAQEQKDGPGEDDIFNSSLSSDLLSWADDDDDGNMAELTQHLRPPSDKSLLDDGSLPVQEEKEDDNEKRIYNGWDTDSQKVWQDEYTRSWEVAEQVVDDREEVEQLYQLPLFSPPQGDELTFAESVAKWNSNRRLPPLLLSN